MLQSLQIRDVVLIQSLDLDFHTGLVVLTGETGAGKSILLDSLGLALGDRAETSLIRNGAAKAQVTATFQLSPCHPAYGTLQEQDIELEDDQIIVRRVLTTEGRNKCFINDQPVTQGFLKGVARQLVEIHGQFDNLLDSKYHRTCLDLFGNVNLADVKSAHSNWSEAQAAYDKAVMTLEQAKEREAFVRFSKEELEKLAPKPDEEEMLTEQRARVANGAKIAEAGQQAGQILNGEGIVSSLVNAQKSLQKVEEYLPGQVTPLVESLERAVVEVEEAAAGVRSLLQDVQGDSHSLEALDDRLHDLRAMARKHNVSIDELAQILDAFSEELSQIDQGDDLLVDLEAKLNHAKEAYKVEAAKVTDKRREAGDKLQSLMDTELKPLKLEQARFSVNIEAAQENHWTEHGWDRLEFHVATNPGSPSGPLHKIASGGELSRLMLALKVILSQNTQTSSLIFDEIDSGTGGAVATAIGVRLKELSQHMQVLVITHSPQVAALGDQHLQVLKTVRGDQTTTHVSELNHDECLEEVARMLSGSEITFEARAQAKQLMVA